MRSLLLILLVLAQAAFAADQNFTFAVPELEGRISLGVFDARGELVRTLFVEAEEKDFKLGLNGLITTWDGKDDAGHDLPPGKYQVDGFVVGGNVKAEGEAYHFNDWVTDEAAGGIFAISTIIPTDGESFLAGGLSMSGADDFSRRIWKFDDPSGPPSISYPLNGRLLAGEAGRLLVGQEPLDASIPPVSRALDLINLANPPEVFSINTGTNGFRNGAFWKSRAYVGWPGARKLEFFDLNPFERVGELATPAEFSQLDASEAALVGSDGTSIWQGSGQDFQKLPLAELPEDFSLAAGPESTLWLAGGKAPDFVVRQHAFDGELLREMKISEPEVRSVRIFADKKALRFFLLLTSDQGITVRGYRPAPGATGDGGVVDWEVFLDRAIIWCARFGAVGGKLVPAAGEAPPINEQKIILPATTLKSKSEPLMVKVTGGPDGVWLKTAAGLPLLRVMEGANFGRVMLLPGEKPNTLRLFAGNGAVVAEYLLTGLDNIASIEAGEIEIPPAKSSP